MENKKNCQQKENVPCSKIRNTKCKLATQKSNEKKMKEKTRKKWRYSGTRTRHVNQLSKWKNYYGKTRKQSE